MTRIRHIQIDGKLYLWRNILQLRREQKKTFARWKRPAFFELKADRRPEADRTASGRYREPSLFSGMSWPLSPDRPYQWASGTLAAAACCQ